MEKLDTWKPSMNRGATTRHGLFPNKKKQSYTPTRSRKPPTFVGVQVQYHDATKNQNEVDEEEEELNDYVDHGYTDNDDEFLPSTTRKKPSFAACKCSCISVITWVNLVGIVILSIFVAIYLHSPHSPSPIVLPNTEKLAATTTTKEFELPFNLVPDGTNNQVVLSTRQFPVDLTKLVSYDVCCQRDAIFVCGLTLKRNASISAHWLARESTLIVHIHHPDMIGAMCRISWRQRE